MTILYVVAESDTVHWSVMSVLCVVAGPDTVHWSITVVFVVAESQHVRAPRWDGAGTGRDQHGLPGRGWRRRCLQRHHHPESCLWKVSIIFRSPDGLFLSVSWLTSVIMYHLPSKLGQKVRTVPSDDPVAALPFVPSVWPLSSNEQKVWTVPSDDPVAALPFVPSVWPFIK